MSADVSRRGFLKLAWGAAGAVALAEAGGVAYMFLSPRTVEGEFGGIFTAGPVESFPPGSVTPFTAGRFYLVREDDGGFVALYRKCTHLGCAVPWEPAEGRFVCPCHASAFERDGERGQRPGAAPARSLRRDHRRRHRPGRHRPPDPARSRSGRRPGVRIGGSPMTKKLSLLGFLGTLLIVAAFGIAILREPARQAQAADRHPRRRGGGRARSLRHQLRRLSRRVGRRHGRLPVAGQRRRPRHGCRGSLPHHRARALQHGDGSLRQRRKAASSPTCRFAAW